jgi:hypothetical protein
VSSTDDMEREPRPIRVVLFSPDPAEPARVTTIEDSDLGIWDALGNAQPGHVFLRGVRAAVLCDENGKAKRLPANRRATLFVDHYVPGFARADTIVGPAVVVGLDDEGWHTDVPEDVVRIALPDPAEGDSRPEQRFLTVDGAGAPLIHLPLPDESAGA